MVHSTFTTARWSPCGVQFSSAGLTWCSVQVLQDHETAINVILAVAYGVASIIMGDDNKYSADRIAGWHRWWRRLGRRPSVYRDPQTTMVLLLVLCTKLSSSCCRQQARPQRSRKYCSVMPVSAGPRSLQTRIFHNLTNQKGMVSY